MIVVGMLVLVILLSEKLMPRVICVQDVFVRGSCVGSIYAKNVNAVKYSKTYLQFFQILKIKPFEIRLKTKTRVS